MWAWVQRWHDRRAVQQWQTVEQRRRRQLEEAAFAERRFVMYLVLTSRAAPVCFTPYEHEAAVFFRNYLVPWMRGTLPFVSHSSWDGLPGGPAATSAPYFEVYRGFDIRQVVVLAPTADYRSRLDQVLAEELRTAEAAAEAQRLAEKSAAYTMMVAVMRDSQRSIEEDGR